MMSNFTCRRYPYDKKAGNWGCIASVRYYWTCGVSSVKLCLLCGIEHSLQSLAEVLDVCATPVSSSGVPLQIAAYKWNWSYAHLHELLQGCVVFGSVTLVM
jgi:hypothetical protein